MTQPLSIDLRERLISAAYEDHNDSSNAGGEIQNIEFGVVYRRFFVHQEAHRQVRQRDHQVLGGICAPQDPCT